MNARRLFVVIVGPSRVGKTTLIKGLLEKSSQYSYVSPYMTRPLRPGETDKYSVSSEEFYKMEANGDFLVVNEHFGYKYGTPLSTINAAISDGRVPVIDYQLSRIKTLEHDEYTLLPIYVRPASIDEWGARLQESGQYTNDRFNDGYEELLDLEDGLYQDIIKDVVMNVEGKCERARDDIIRIVDARLRSS